MLCFTLSPFIIALHCIILKPHTSRLTLTRHPASTINRADLKPGPANIHMHMYTYTQTHIHTCTHKNTAVHSMTNTFMYGPVYAHTHTQIKKKHPISTLKHTHRVCTETRALYIYVYYITMYSTFMHTMYTSSLCILHLRILCKLCILYHFYTISQKHDRHYFDIASRSKFSLSSS